MFVHSKVLAKRLADESPVVIMARGHSGTRILAWAIQHLGIRLGATEDVATGDVQDLAFSRMIKQICRSSLSQPSIAEPQASHLRAFQRAVDRYRRGLDETASGWGWKFPETYLIPNYVAKTFPHARYIHLIRDGRDIAFKHHLTDDQERRLGHQLLKHLGALNLPHHVQAAMSWEFQIRRFEEFVDHARPPMHTVRFEALCSDPLQSMQEICEFLGREMTDACREFLSQVDARKIAQFRHEDPQHLAEAEAAITPLLDQLDYLKRQAA